MEKEPTDEEKLANRGLSHPVKIIMSSLAKHGIEVKDRPNIAIDILQDLDDENWSLMAGLNNIREADYSIRHGLDFYNF